MMRALHGPAKGLLGVGAVDQDSVIEEVTA
jgi:hypothetical protein